MRVLGVASVEWVAVVGGVVTALAAFVQLIVLRVVFARRRAERHGYVIRLRIGRGGAIVELDLKKPEDAAAYLAALDEGEGQVAHSVKRTDRPSSGSRPEDKNA